MNTMNATHIPIEDFPSFEEWEIPILTNSEIEDIITETELRLQEEIICRSLQKLPPDLPRQDALLFGVMLANIMDAPMQPPSGARVP